MERVPELKRAGALLVACCPFHDEKSPSFKVDPRRGTWHCYGACSRGGDQISFVMEFDRVDFRDALEILAAKTGVELRPADPAHRKASEEDAAGRATLERAERFFVRKLASDEGRGAREYLEARGLSTEVLADFGIGYAPAGGTVLADDARRAGLDLTMLEQTGLTRRNDRGRAYDFFRGRLMIPIRDERGRTVGFGARRLSDGDESGPKYVNSPETRLFHKGRLIYGLDLAIDTARRSGHLILVEGYTDVMAAHRAGLKNVGAVLGTSTTEDHAGLVRRAGARRVSLVFDGDEAGSRAASRALHGLLPLDIEIRIATLPKGTDPCDLLSSSDGDFDSARESFLALLDASPDWFEYCLNGLDGLRGHELSEGVDAILDVLQRLGKPVHRETRLVELAERLKLPAESLREQWRDLPSRKREERDAARAKVQRREARAQAAPVLTNQTEATSSGAPRTESERQTTPPIEPQTVPQPKKRSDRVDLQALGGLLGAVLLDTSLAPLLKAYQDPCPAHELAPILEAILALYEREVDVIDASRVMTELQEDPIRERVVPILEFAQRAESPQALFEDGVSFLNKRTLERERKQLHACISETERLTQDPETEVAERALLELPVLMRRMEALVRPLTNSVHEDRGLSPQPS